MLLNTPGIAAVRRWQAIAEGDFQAMSDAIDRSDWPEAHRLAVNLGWDAAPIARAALELAREG